MMLDLLPPPQVSGWVQVLMGSGSARLLEPGEQAAMDVAAYVREGAAKFRSWPKLPLDADISESPLFD